LAHGVHVQRIAVDVADEHGVDAAGAERIQADDDR
jgi:hypothetical protein